MRDRCRQAAAEGRGGALLPVLARNLAWVCDALLAAQKKADAWDSLVDTVGALASAGGEPDPKVEALLNYADECLRLRARVAELEGRGAQPPLHPPEEGLA